MIDWLIAYTLPSVSRRHQDLPSVTCALGLDLARVSREACALTHLSHGWAFMRHRRKEEVFLGTVCTDRWENGGRISPIADRVPGQPVTDVRFLSHMIEMW